MYLLSVLREPLEKRVWVKSWLQDREASSHMSLLRELRQSHHEDLTNYLRMSEENFQKLLHLVASRITKVDTHLRQAITAEERLTATLRFLATGQSFEDLKFPTRISPQALGKIIPETCEQLYLALKDSYLKGNSMALLYRFVKVPDRANSHVFTFIVTKSVTRDLERDVTSKEFSCGHQKWAITFSRTDKVLGVYLVWKSTSDLMRVYVDFSFTILNREHFSVNEGFSGKQVKFTLDCPAQGNRNYIPVSDLYTRNFTDNNGEFQLELSMGHVRTMFDTEFRLPTSMFGQITRGQSPVAKLPTKVETTYFSFGGFDWNLALYPQGTSDPHSRNADGRLSLYLNRCTGFDHQCRVRYSVVLGDGDRRLDSGIVDDVSDSDGKSYGWHPRTRFTDLVYKGSIRVHLEMMLANTLSEVVSSVVLQPAQGSGAVAVTAQGVSQAYDRDKQGWIIKTDCHSETVRLHMVFKDIHNVPRNHLRYVSWTAYMLRYHKNLVEPIPIPSAPFSHYYAQDVSDEGIIMETEITVKELREPGCPYLNEKGQLRVQVEWEESYLLFQATYHKYDDIYKVHNQQMKKEISALQAENYGLERQLFSYQKSIAYAHSRGGYSDDMQSPEGREEEDEQFYQDRNYSLGDRSLSTDTEYA